MKNLKSIYMAKPSSNIHSVSYRPEPLENGNFLLEVTYKKGDRYSAVISPSELETLESTAADPNGSVGSLLRALVNEAHQYQKLS